MLFKYTSHAAYCALLGVLLSKYEALDAFDDDSATLLWFLRGLVAFSTLSLAAAVFFDLYGTGYSRTGERLPRPFDPFAVLLYALAIAVNVSLCAASAWLSRAAWGFPVRLEIGGATLLLLATNGFSLAYNARAAPRIGSFYESKGIVLWRHARWSVALGNLGTSFRCYKRVIMFAICRLVWPSVPTLAELLPSWQYPTVWAAVGLAFATPLAIGLALLQYHFGHRWLHASPTLYLLVHKVHHLARYPIPSDAGTESPLELCINEVTMLMPLSPFWLWLPGEAKIMADHIDAHTFESGNRQLAQKEESPSAHHMLHHSKNVGNYSIPPLDARFGTRIDPSKIAPFVLGC